METVTVSARLHDSCKWSSLSARRRAIPFPWLSSVLVFCGVLLRRGCCLQVGRNRARCRTCGRPCPIRLPSIQADSLVLADLCPPSGPAGLFSFDQTAADLLEVADAKPPRPTIDALLLPKPRSSRVYTDVLLLPQPCTLPATRTLMELVDGSQPALAVRIDSRQMGRAVGSASQ